MSEGMEEDGEWRVVMTPDGIEICEYAISSNGQIRRTAASRISKNQILKSFPHNTGYLAVNLHSKGVQKTYKVHALVCASFHGVRPGARHCVRHIDGIKTNNVASNLKWGTYKENSEDAIRHGHVPRGAKHGRPHGRLTRRQVNNVKLCLLRGENQTAIAKRFGISPQQVTNIKMGRCYDYWPVIIPGPQNLG